MEIVLRTKNLGKRFGERWIFRSISIEVSSGQVLVVRGGNGSGKSTFLRCLAGLLSPSSGEVETSHTCGYYGLDMALYGDLTPMEHAELLGHPNAEIFETVGLKESANQMVKEFSTGMRGRAKLALSRIENPTIWLLDEPTAALDHQGIAVLSDLVQQHAKTGAVIIATNAEADLNWGTHELVLG